MRTLFGNYGIIDRDIHKEIPRIDVTNLYPKHFDILTTNPYWSKHPILERYKEYEQEIRKKEKEMTYNNFHYTFTYSEIENTLKAIACVCHVEVMTEFDCTKEKVKAIFYDRNNMDRTQLIVLILKELKCGWDQSVYETVKNRFDYKDGYNARYYFFDDTPLITNVTIPKIEFKNIDPIDFKKIDLPVGMPKIKNVKFNGPATIIFWSDDTKTVVKAQDEEFDPEKGLAMAIAKKALGNKHDYFNVITKYAKRYYKENKNANN